MQYSDVSFLFQVVLLIILSGIIPFCQHAKPPASQQKQAPVVKAKKNKVKSKEKKEIKKEDEMEDEDRQKDFPGFVMPTESQKKIKLKEVEDEKKKKIKEGYFQENSDQDDTLEKIESLKVEKSDRTKRAAKKKKH